MHVQPTTRVRVLHSDPVMAAGLNAVLRGGFRVETGDEGGRWPDLSAVDVIVCDYQNGIALMSMLRSERPAAASGATKVLVVSDIDREWAIRSAISAGVSGYVLQGCPIEELFDGITCIGQGQRYLSRSVARRIADSMSREALTARESEVLLLLTTGSCNKAIAKELGIALGTVKTHVKGILEKLGVASRTQAVAIAGELGIVSRFDSPSSLRA